MLRTIQARFNDVQPVPSSLRKDPRVDEPVDETGVNLGQLFQHYYFDSYGPGAPAPDPSSFEYLQLVAPQSDFRFLERIGEVSTVKKRALSTELGQAFCRWMLSEHFSMRYFAHMSNVLGKPTHAAFDGMRIERSQKGDVPDYLCARQVTRPYIAEAKGRFSAIDFDTAEFRDWREQFKRIRVSDQRGSRIKLKGYIVGARFSTEGQRATTRTTIYTEDPETDGDEPRQDQARALGRVIAAMHYARVFLKLDLRAFAASLENGFPLAQELQFHVPVWTCLVPPLKDVKFIGGFYRTQDGRLPELRDGKWVASPELGRGHAAFVGLKLEVARDVARAARGDWGALDALPEVAPEGPWSSEFSWLRDGTVIAPLEYFQPVGTVAL